MQRLLEGWIPQDVAALLGVDPRSVRRWRQAFREHGWSGLEPREHPGRPAHLDDEQRREVLAWIDQRPEDFGFIGSRWTARRIAWLIADHWGIQFNRRYLNTWLAQQGISPQRPQRQAREKDPRAIARWLAQDWPRIKKKPAAKAPRWCSWTKRGF
jgi:transposase